MMSVDYDVLEKESMSAAENRRRTVKVGLLGLGTVGSGVVKILDRHREEIGRQTASDIQVEKILVQDLGKKRSVDVQAEQLTTAAEDVIHHPDIHVVIEVMGSIEPARSYILEALERGKHIVTANKDLMALHGAEILAKAQEKGCDVFYEASVAGGIPIIRALVESFASDRITKMMGIVNGTTNFILSKMSQEGADFEEALKEAQALGYAEADPTADVEGFDAARKMAILGTLGFNTHVTLDDIDCRGITGVLPEDIKYGQQLGYEMKLLGLADRQDDMIELSVQPTLVDKKHPLASVNGEYNAVYVYGEAVGETMFYGPGAGELPTATSVVSDLVTVVQNRRLGISGRRVVAPYKEKKLKTDEQVVAKYFLRLHVKDEAGVLAQITRVLADAGVSIEKVFQEPVADEKMSEIIIITHHANRLSMKNILQKFKEMDVVFELKSMYRVEGEQQ